MNKLLALLLIFSSLAFSQEAPPESDPNVELRVIEVDPRCSNAVLWSAQLVDGRRSGTPVKEVLNALAYDIQFGSLQNYPKDTINYLLNIVLTVYSAESVEKNEDIFTIFELVNSDCVKFLEGPPKEERPKLST